MDEKPIIFKPKSYEVKKENYVINRNAPQKQMMNEVQMILGFEYDPLIREWWNEVAGKRKSEVFIDGGQIKIMLIDCYINDWRVSDMGRGLDPIMEVVLMAQKMKTLSKEDKPEPVEWRRYDELILGEQEILNMKKSAYRRKL